MGKRIYNSIRIKVDTLEKKRVWGSKNERPVGKKISNHHAHVPGRGLVRVVLGQEQKTGKMSHLTRFPSHNVVMLLMPQSFTHPTAAPTFRYHLAVRAVVADMRRYSTPCYSSISIGVVWRSWMLPHQLLFESIQKRRPEDVDEKVSQPQERPTSKTWKRSREKAERKRQRGR